MLSILIPVYNFDIRKLVQQLHEQGSLLSIPFEIICVEDASKEEFAHLNKELKDLEYVIHEILPQNLGRSKIRNYLATKAKYEYLLFMDCDSMPVSDNYLQNYIQHLQPRQLLYGGRSYQNTAPTNPDLYFHWYYGKNREESKAAIRQQQPYQSFMTNNFLIPKAILQAILFDENLTQYGHEDTLFGLELEKRKIPILHLDNPLEHIGLEINSVFIHKSELAIQNLYWLHQNRHLSQEVKLLRFYLWTKKCYLNFIILPIYKLSQKIILRNLCSNRPILRLFDFYKLGYLVAWGWKR